MTALKLTPVVLAWWLITQRRWTAVRAFIVGGLVVAAVSVLGAGLSAHFEYLGIVRQTSTTGTSDLSLAGMARFVGVTRASRACCRRSRSWSGSSHLAPARSAGSRLRRGGRHDAPRVAGREHQLVHGAAGGAGSRGRGLCRNPGSTSGCHGDRKVEGLLPEPRRVMRAT